MQNNLDNLINKLWNCIYQGAQIIESNNEYVTYNKKSKDIFKQMFKQLYTYIVNNYMEDDKEALDRHKVAAISIIATINAEVILSNKDDENEIFFGNYTLGIDCAFQYMLSELNKRLEEKGEKHIEGYFFPEAMACETNYYRIFYRNLYFANDNKQWGLNPLDIAERLFLIEYMTLEKKEIDPKILKEY